MKRCFFNCIPFLSAHYQTSDLFQIKINYMLSKNIECLSTSLVTNKEGDFLWFCLLFGVVPGSLQPVLACYGLLRVDPLFRSDDVTYFFFHFQIYNESTSCRFYCKVGQALLQSVAALMCYEVGQLFCI